MRYDKEDVAQAAYQIGWRSENPCEKIDVNEYGYHSTSEHCP